MWTMIFLYRVPALRDIVLILAGSALGIGFVIAFPAWIALLTSTGDAMRRGTLLGAVASAQGVGMLCGAAIGTTLYSHGSANVATAHIMPFYVSAIMLSLSTLLAFVLVHDPRPTVRAVT
jgi:MFS family permease